mgnify:CR=1 FL=1
MQTVKKNSGKIIDVVPFIDPPVGKRGGARTTHRRCSVRQAIKAHRKATPATVFSHFLTEVRDSKGKLKYQHSRPGWRHNLTTDTATGYTNRRDWQAKAMGGGLPPVATMTGNATSVSATSLTNTGASFPTAGQGLAGMIVVAGPRATSSAGDAISFGVIVSNSGTVLTIDKWYSGGTWGTGTTPNGTCSYTVLPGQMPAMFLAVTSDAGAPSAADTTLASEATTNGFARALATWAHTAAATTYTLQVMFTASGTLTVNKEAVFGAANTTAGGVMPFESAEPSPPTLISGDTLTQTVTITIN